MMNKIMLSYTLTTFNKLPYLSVTLPLLINQKKSDEEIVIVDGGSTDGTVEYLQKLFEEKKIDQFISEKDHGEAHGTNKAMLMARGDLIKIITDDDVYHYPTINGCKIFMKNNRSIDILGFDGVGFNINHKVSVYNKTEVVKDFRNWKSTGTPFMICGLSFMLRRSSLAYLGLFNANFKIIDFEYSIRVTSMRSKIAFYTGVGFVNIVNPESNSHKFYEIISRERKLLEKLYPNYNHKITFKKSIVKFKEIILKNVLKKKAVAGARHDYKKIVETGIKLLDEYNDGQAFNFLT